MNIFIAIRKYFTSLKAYYLPYMLACIRFEYIAFGGICPACAGSKYRNELLNANTFPMLSYVYRAKLFFNMLCSYAAKRYVAIFVTLLNFIIMQTIILSPSDKSRANGLHFIQIF